MIDNSLICAFDQFLRKYGKTYCVTGFSLTWRSTRISYSGSMVNAGDMFVITQTKNLATSFFKLFENITISGFLPFMLSQFRVA